MCECVCAAYFYLVNCVVLFVYCFRCSNFLLGWCFILFPCFFLWAWGLFYWHLVFEKEKGSWVGRGGRKDQEGLGERKNMIKIYSKLKTVLNIKT